ncbi:DUF6777 domain-containing protein [Streptomyces sp. NPDC048629]|uniref:DUF6777 domain-containing protein n=1 Tax=Streptomyces sp. NPDC048629 TaxID=3154824 RepID=UPI0034464ED0
MTSQPPSGRPTGPPSGPLSGPSSRPGSSGPPPPSGPPYGGGQGGGSGGSGGGGGFGGRGGGAGGGRGGGEGPWWRSVPKIAAITAALVAAVVLAVVLTRSDDGGDQAGGGGGEVFLQSASAAGPDPFTKSSAREPDTAQSPATLPAPTGGTGTNVTRSVSGSAEGLYGGTKNVASCNVQQQIDFLAAEPAKNKAFASVLGISESAVPGYLRGLTPLQLRVDTRVTNHGYKDGGPTAYQAVLQAGTAVMVDDRGVPRVRCACGNPLTTPVPQKTAPKTTGTAWPGYQAQNVVVVAPSVTVVNIFVIYDPDDDAWFTRKPGHHGRTDKPTSPPTAPASPSVSPSDSPTKSSPPPSSPVPCVTVTDPSQSLGPSQSPCPSSLAPPSSASPDTLSPVTPDPESPPPQPVVPDSPSDGTTTDQSAGVESSPVSPDAGPGSSSPAQGPDASFFGPTL